jgi:hypothetical protein
VSPFRDIISGQTFENTIIVLAGVRYQHCKFKRCRMVYDGTDVYAFANCVFVECEWSFEGPAENTLEFMAALNTGLGEEGENLVNSIFAKIRTGSVKDQEIPLLRA